MFWNTCSHRVLKIYYDTFFDLLHVHMNKNHQVKSVLYAYILGKSLCEREENTFRNNEFSLYYIDLKISKLNL